MAEQKLKKTVMVDVCQTQSLDGRRVVELEDEAVGSLYSLDDDGFILAYDTLLGERKVTTTIKVVRDTVSVVRIGEVHARQTFALNEWFACQYFYGGASLICRNYTKKLDYAITPDGGLIDVLYELWSGDTQLGYYNLEVFVR